MSWEKIFSTRVFAEASIIEGLLADNDVPVQLLNKQDSSIQCLVTFNFMYHMIWSYLRANLLINSQNI